MLMLNTNQDCSYSKRSSVCFLLLRLRLWKKENLSQHSAPTSMHTKITLNVIYTRTWQKKKRKPLKTVSKAHTHTPASYSPQMKYNTDTYHFYILKGGYGKSKWKKREAWVLTFLCILQPFNKLFHLFEEHTLSLGKVGIIVPLQNCLLTQNIRFRKKEKGREKEKEHKYC